MGKATVLATWNLLVWHIWLSRRSGFMNQCRMGVYMLRMKIPAEKFTNISPIHILYNMDTADEADHYDLLLEKNPYIQNRSRLFLFGQMNVQCSIRGMMGVWVAMANKWPMNVLNPGLTSTTDISAIGSDARGSDGRVMGQPPAPMTTQPAAPTQGQPAASPHDGPACSSHYHTACISHQGPAYSPHYHPCSSHFNFIGKGKQSDSLCMYVVLHNWQFLMNWVTVCALVILGVWTQKETIQSVAVQREGGIPVGKRIPTL